MILVIMIPPASSAQSSREEFVDVGAAVASIVFDVVGAAIRVFSSFRRKTDCGHSLVFVVFDVVGAAIRVFEGKPTADTAWYLFRGGSTVVFFWIRKSRLYSSLECRYQYVVSVLPSRINQSNLTMTMYPKSLSFYSYSSKYESRTSKRI
jgi:hypothetical protein